MGSKRAMLENGLASILRHEAEACSRFVDLFCGAASVSWFAATELNLPVVSVDLQQYATTLAAAVVCRDSHLENDAIEVSWIQHARTRREEYPEWQHAKKLDRGGWNTATWRKKAQELCGSTADDAGGPLLWSAYGGHYYSPTQALTFDALLSSLPSEPLLRTTCLASLIVAASACAASPGHTAQPFKASRTARKYLREAWLRDPIEQVRKAAIQISSLKANQVGQAVVGDANNVAVEAGEGDLVFIDPPYSAVQYSRFYHVLETIARGELSSVSGVGRYPPPSERPVSDYSVKSSAMEAMKSLLSTLSLRKCVVVLTFPVGECSNGLSGRQIADMAAEEFQVKEKIVKTRFRTLGGNTVNRTAINISDELILVLSPG